MDLEAFESILGGVRLPKAVRDHLKSHTVWSRWGEIVGPELSKVTQPFEIKNKQLLVHVAHQAWAQQLHFLSPSILGKIRQLCPSTTVREIIFRVGKVEKHVSREERRREAEELPKITVKLSERMEMTLRAVEDEDLRAVIRRAMEAAAKRRAATG